MLKSSSLLSLSLLAAAAAAQESPAAADPALVCTFGAAGEPGSFRVQFDRRGAGVVAVHLLDHYRSLEASRRTPHELDDHLLLVWSVWNGNDHALRWFADRTDGRLPLDPATAEWQAAELRDGDRLVGVRFTLGNGGLLLEKTWRHDPAQRGFQLELAVTNQSAEPGGAPLACELNGPALVNPAESTLIGNTSVAIAAGTGGATHHVGPSPGAAQELTVDPRALSFAGATNRFFGAFLFPRDEAAAKCGTALRVDTMPARDDPDTGTLANSTVRVRYALSLAVPPRGERAAVTFGFYLGPKSYRVFGGLADPERFAPVLDVDLTAPCCVVEVPGGRMMAKILLRLLDWFHSVVDNWGVAIIMLTMLVRGLLAPVNFRMQKAMRAYSARMAVLKPKLDALKVRYGDDQKAYQQAMLAFQRENKLMPPIGGCLPIFLTMPIYIGLFTALRTAYDLRQQPFAAWIDDLSRADALFQLPFWPHDFNLLPLVWIALLVWMTLRQPLPTDPQQRQQAAIIRYVPILFGVMLYGYAAALLVYMVTSMVWSLGESAVVKRILGPVDPNVAAMAPTPM